MKLQFIIIFIFGFAFSNSSANTIKPIVTINNSVITNYDLFLEIELFKLLKQIDVNKNIENQILDNLISNKIKELELLNYKIDINEKILEDKANELFKKNNNDELKSILLKQIIVDSKWNKLIFLKFKRKLEINIMEIEERHGKQLDYKRKNQLMEIEKNKKIQIISKTFFNEVKKKYYIKKY